MGYKQGMKVKKSLSNPPYFWLPNREICGDFRNLSTGEPEKKSIIFSASSKKNLATQ
jgi:hypothetical protein